MNLVIIAHNIRSTHNVGAILRTADGFGVTHVYCTGYTPYPTLPHDDRLPHISKKLTAQIHKTALGAETTVPITHDTNVLRVIKEVRLKGFTIAALEQSSQSTLLPDFASPPKLALLLGEEVNGTPPDVLNECDVILEIPMVGHKESFNVSVAAGIAMYAITLRS